MDREGKENFISTQRRYRWNTGADHNRLKTDESRVSVGDTPFVANKMPESVKAHKDKYGRAAEYWHKKESKPREKLRHLQDEHHLVLQQIEDQDQKPKKLDYKKKKSHSSFEKKKMEFEKDIAKIKKMLEVGLPEQALRAEAYLGWIRE